MRMVLLLLALTSCSSTARTTVSGEGSAVDMGAVTGSSNESGASGGSGGQGGTGTTDNVTVTGSVGSVATTTGAPSAGGASGTTSTGTGGEPTVTATATGPSSTTSQATSSTSSAGGSSSTTGSMPVPGCSSVFIGDCTNGSQGGSYSCPDGESGYYSTDGRRWLYNPVDEQDISCAADQFNQECRGLGEGCAGDTVPDEPDVPGCQLCSPQSRTNSSYCYWHPVDFPEGECFSCPQGWADCDGQAPEFEGWAGGPEMGCETRASALNELGQCGECGPDPNTCECDIDGNCTGGW